MHQTASTQSLPNQKRVRVKEKIRRKKEGVKQKKTVCGNTIHAKVSQINLMVLKHGSKPLGKEEPKEGASEAKPAESTN